MAGSNRVVGGRSVWGCFLDEVCKRYHWTFDYVVWGVSYQNINMMLSDSIQTFYGTLKGDRHNTKIDAGDPRNTELIRKLMND